ncbi:MAG: hypothetical protein DWQ37_11345 [Planctomycetota bacterium]|nr:MAG: hypothetical protein DWQ37_11345 [Planctomycetota bacterium]
MHTTTPIRLFVLPLALLIAPPALGQQSSRSRPGDDSTDARQRDARDRSQSRSSRDRRNEQSSQSQRIRNADAAIFAAGYLAGYADGLEDFIVVRRQQDQRAQRDSRDGSMDRQQLRDTLRRRARQELSGRGRRPSNRSRQQRVSGEILATKQVQLKNDEKRHLILLIENRDGRRRVVDAGPIQKLSDLSLARGDQISATGAILATQDRVPVVVARRIESNGNRITIDGAGSDSHSGS